MLYGDRGGFLSGYVVPQLTVNGNIIGGAGDALYNTSGFWNAPGYNATSPSNGFRFSGSTSLTSGANGGLVVSDIQAMSLRSTSQLTTPNAVATNMPTGYTPNDDEVVAGTVFVMARNAAAVGAGYLIHFAGRKTGGVATLIGAIAAPLVAEDAGLAAAAATVIASGGSFVVQVNGIAGSVTWDAFWLVGVGQ